MCDFVLAAGLEDVNPVSEEFGMSWKSGEEMEFDREVELERLGFDGVAATA